MYIILYMCFFLNLGARAIPIKADRTVMNTNTKKLAAITVVGNPLLASRSRTGTATSPRSSIINATQNDSSGSSSIGKDLMSALQAVSEEELIDKETDNTDSNPQGEFNYTKERESLSPSISPTSPMNVHEEMSPLVARLKGGERSRSSSSTNKNISLAADSPSINTSSSTSVPINPAVIVSPLNSARSTSSRPDSSRKLKTPIVSHTIEEERDLNIPRLFKTDLPISNTVKTRVGGMLMKSPRKSMFLSPGRKQERYFFINLNVTDNQIYGLEYARSEKEAESTKVSRNMFPLEGSEVEKVSDLEFTLELPSGDVYTLEAASTELRDKWVISLQKAIKVTCERSQYIRDKNIELEYYCNPQNYERLMSTDMSVSDESDTDSRTNSTGTGLRTTSSSVHPVFNNRNSLRLAMQFSNRSISSDSSVSEDHRIIRLDTFGLPIIKDSDIRLLDSLSKDGTRFGQLIMKKTNKATFFNQNKFQERYFFVRLNLKANENYELEYSRNSEITSKTKKKFPLVNATVVKLSGNCFSLKVCMDYEDITLCLEAYTTQKRDQWVRTLEAIIRVASLRRAEVVRGFAISMRLAEPPVLRDDRIDGTETPSPALLAVIDSTGTNGDTAHQEPSTLTLAPLSDTKIFNAMSAIENMQKAASQIAKEDNDESSVRSVSTLKEKLGHLIPMSQASHDLSRTRSAESSSSTPVESAYDNEESPSLEGGDPGTADDELMRSSTISRPTIQQGARRGPTRKALVAAEEDNII